MANQITDNRTSLTTNDAVTGIDDETGAAAGNQNTETFVEGTASTSNKISNTTGGLLYDAGSAQNWSNNTFYLWWNVSTAGKLDTRANGGVRVRFCGATVTDFFEIYVAGSDTYTGGFEMSVIDIERAYTAAVTDGDAFTGTGGTPPATNAIRWVGMFYDVASMISGNIDNVFFDACWRLPTATPGIIVEGRDGGSTDWTWDDIFQAGDPGDTTKAWGSVFLVDGVYFFNTPIQFGINDTSTHGFTDTSQLVGWQDQFVDLTDFYQIELLGNSGGTTNFTLGTSTGSGDDRVGTLGGVIFAAPSAPRWSFVADDANIDTCDLFGAQFIHGEDFQLDDATCQVISSSFLDCTSATVSNATILKCNIIDANTADGAAFMITDDLTDIVRCNFVFSDGHAIQLTTPRVANQISKGNTYTGYGGTPGSNLVANSGSTDAAVYNLTAGAVEIGITDGGDTPAVRNGPSATTTVTNNVTLTINVSDEDGTAVQNAQTAIFDSGATELMNEDTTAGGVATETYAYTADEDITIRVRKNSPGDTRYLPFTGTGTITNAGFTLNVRLIEDPNAS